jgi:hypothetical protein
MLQVGRLRTLLLADERATDASSFFPGHPMKPFRMRMTHDLIVNYGLEKHMQIFRPDRATPKEMTKFHSGARFTLGLLFAAMVPLTLLSLQTTTSST